MPSAETTLIAINRVRADRAEEFENWLRTVVVPVVNDHRPHLAERWRVLRAADEEDGVRVYAFVCSGGTAQDWELDPVLEEAFGPERAERELATFGGMLAEEQGGWMFTDVHLDGG